MTHNIKSHFHHQTWIFFFYPPKSDFFFENRPFSLLDDHNIMTWGQLYNLESVPSILKPRKWFFHVLRPQKHKKLNWNLINLPYFDDFKAFLLIFLCISLSRTVTWDDFLSAVWPSIFHISSRFWRRIVWNFEISNNSTSKSRGDMKNRRPHCGKEIVSSDCSWEGNTQKNE